MRKSQNTKLLTGIIIVINHLKYLVCVAAEYFWVQEYIICI